MKIHFLAIAATLVVAGCSSTPKGPPDPLNIENKVQAAATVMAIDPVKRTFTLRTDRGDVVPLEASAAVRNLEQVRVGDRVTVTYFEAIGAQMRKPGDSTDATIDLGAGRSNPGERPGGVVATVQTIPVTIVSVDTKTNTVKFFAADRQERSITVTRPEAKAYIARLKAGDEVIVTYSEAVAIEVKSLADASPIRPAQ